MNTLDTVFDLLSDERRRYVLYYLHEQSGPVSVDKLAETIRTWEDDPPTQNVLEGVDALKVELQHRHLPKTAEVEFVQYQPEQGVIQVEGTSPEIDALVTIARVIEQPEDS
ncbi:DUF7344 domain-containing protein [Natrinema salinisoli]|uniref:DUF7344 domain-containing protein n=1 Tax=Natrinema salinisoli TaxID=2878535 RepID=UPI001CF0CEFB|nr:hypothetical protein [Natrinema salinisoli]